MSVNIKLTTGTYDLVREHLRRKRVTKDKEEILSEELKNAEQMFRKEMPENTVDLNTVVTYKNLITEEEKTVIFVSPKKSKPSKNKISILSDDGIAMLGYQTGQIVDWPDKKLEIIKVERFQ